jgi:hypothetical protein
MIWSLGVGFQREHFGTKTKNEYLVIGAVPQRLLSLAFTIESLKRLGYQDLFPRLPLGYITSKDLDDLRAAMRQGSAAFDVAKHQTKFFLACLVEHQEGIYPHDASTRQLVMHFVALENGCLFNHSAKTICTRVSRI